MGLAQSYGLNCNPRSRSNTLAFNRIISAENLASYYIEIFYSTEEPLFKVCIVEASVYISCTQFAQDL